MTNIIRMTHRADPNDICQTMKTNHNNSEQIESSLIPRLRSAKIIGSTLYADAADAIERLSAESNTKGQLITAQLALAEERNARITELEVELTAARETISKQDGELGKLRRLLELDEE